MLDGQQSCFYESLAAITGCEGFVYAEKFFKQFTERGEYHDITRLVRGDSNLMMFLQGN